MQRVTVTVDDSLLALARADVEAGRAHSVSAWVADAVRRKALARVELIDELAEMVAAEPYDDETVSWVAGVLGRPAEWVAARLSPGSEPARQAAG
jgi:Arc/MetJ-type ribon-helix-helix transcriptional regulator